MKTGTKIALLAAGGIAIAGFAYYRAAKQLQFGLQNVTFEADGKLNVTLAVNNPSGFGFPVPMLNLGVFDANDVYLGTIQSNVLQYIPAGGGLIQGVVLPNYNSIFSTLTNYFMQSLPQQLILQGTVSVGRIQVPVQTQIQTA